MASSIPLTPDYGVDQFVSRVNDQTEFTPLVRSISDWISTEEQILFAFGDSEFPADLIAAACVVALSRIDVPEIVSYVWPMGVDSSLNYLDGMLIKTAAALGSGPLLYNHVSTIAARLISECRLIPVFVPALTPPPGSQAGVGGLGQANAPPVKPTKSSEIRLPETYTFWNAVGRIRGEQGRAIVVAPASWQNTIPAGWTGRTLRVQPAPATKAR